MIKHFCVLVLAATLMCGCENAPDRDSKSPAKNTSDKLSETSSAKPTSTEPATVETKLKELDQAVAGTDSQKVQAVGVEVLALVMARRQDMQKKGHELTDFEEGQYSQVLLSVVEGVQKKSAEVEAKYAELKELVKTAVAKK